MSDKSSTLKPTDEAIESIAELDRQATAELSHNQRFIERATSNLGRPRTAYIIVIFSLAWMILNLVLRASGRAFDPPPFSMLSMIVSLAALLMTTFILTTEHRMNQHDLRRDRLDLQINLLTERKISKVIEMLEAMRRDSPSIPNRNDPEARELRRASDPHEIIKALDERTPD